MQARPLFGRCAPKCLGVICKPSYAAAIYEMVGTFVSPIDPGCVSLLGSNGRESLA